MAGYQYSSPQHERLSARVLTIKEKLLGIANELDDMPAGVLTPEEDDILGRVVTLLHIIDDEFLPFT